MAQTAYKNKRLEQFWFESSQFLIRRKSPRSVCQCVEFLTKKDQMFEKVQTHHSFVRGGKFMLIRIDND